MNVQPSSKVSPQYEQLNSPPAARRPNDAAVDAIRDRAFEEQPERMVRKARKVVSYHESQEFPELLAQLKDNFSSNKPNHKKAFILATNLYGFHLVNTLTTKDTKDLFNMFEKIAAKGLRLGHKEYYAFIKGALARHQHQTPGTNPALVEKSYREAAALGDDCSWYYLGEFLDQQGRYTEAFEQFEACTQKYPNQPYAYKEMAKYYQNGWADNPVNVEKAKDFYTHAIARGCVESAFNLPVLLESMPCLTDEDRQRVIDLYKDAVKKGASDAAYNLGVISQHGWYRTTEDGVKVFNEEYVNIPEAEACYRKSNEMNPHPTTAIALAEIAALNNDRNQGARVEEMRDLADNLRQEGSLRTLELEKMVEEATYLLLHTSDEDIELPSFDISAVDFEYDLKGLKGIAETASRKQPLKVPVKTVIILDPVDAEIARLNKALLDDPTNTDLLFELTLATMK